MSEPRLVPVGPGRREVTELDGSPEPEAEVEDQLDPRRGRGDPTAATDDGSGDATEIDPGDAPEELGAASVADIEALLFVAERPLSRAELRAVARLSAEEVDERLGDLEIELRDRGVRLVLSGEQVMLGTAPESGPLIARYLGADAVRLSPAALETLAIIAYRQPVTRGVIERIRGVDCGHVVRGLLHRRLIHEQGRADSPGRPILYATSMEFMERFGLTSLDDLPPIEADIAARLAQAEADVATAEGLLGVDVTPGPSVAATPAEADSATPDPDDV